ncbi:hypothetical protein, partial [Staphylococcus pseudintermedius]|uniref:hypothetical protein n=1 Tax=Staphylococcus pseudintermedius TaxID=283734 RepID=UPI001F5BADA8
MAKLLKVLRTLLARLRAKFETEFLMFDQVLDNQFLRLVKMLCVLLNKLLKYLTTPITNILAKLMTVFLTTVHIRIPITLIAVKTVTIVFFIFVKIVTAAVF